MRIKSEQSEEVFALNLTSMIDVVFLLIIFFMVSTTFMNIEKEMDLELPEASSGRIEELEKDEVIINVLADGRMKMGDTFYEMEPLVDRLKRVAMANKETPVTIRGDKGTDFQNAVRAMDACQRSGLRRISVGILGTDPGVSR